MLSAVTRDVPEEMRRVLVSSNDSETGSGHANRGRARQTRSGSPYVENQGYEPHDTDEELTEEDTINMYCDEYYEAMPDYVPFLPI